MPALIKYEDFLPVCVHNPVLDAVTGLVPPKVGMGATDEQSLPPVNQAARAFSRAVGQATKTGMGTWSGSRTGNEKLGG